MPLRSCHRRSPLALKISPERKRSQTLTSHNPSFTTQGVYHIADPIELSTNSVAREMSQYTRTPVLEGVNWLKGVAVKACS